MNKYPRVAICIFPTNVEKTHKTFYVTGRHPLALSRIILRQRVGTKLRSIAKGIKSRADETRRRGHIKGPSAITDRPEIGTERFPFRLPLSFTPSPIARSVAVHRTSHAYMYIYVRTYRNREGAAPRTIGTRTVFFSLFGLVASTIASPNIVFYTSATSSSAFSVPRVRRRRLVSHGLALFRTL